jgi:putative permease
VNASEPPTRRYSFCYDDARRLVGLVLLIVLGWLLIRALKPVLFLFAIVFLLAMVLNPLVVVLEKRRVPRGVGVALIAIGALIVIAGLALLIGPPLVEQVQELISRTPAIWTSIRGQIARLAAAYPWLQNALPEADQLVNTIGAEVGDVAAFLLRSTYTVVGAVITLLFALLLFIFVLANPRPIVAAYLALVPDSQRTRARRALARMMRQMTAWARGVAINGAITGVSTGVLLALVGVQPAMVFGALAFLGEFLPMVGPVLVSIPVLIVALSMGLTKFFLALAVVIFVHQVETTLLVPFVLGHEMRLNPVMILFFTLAMGSIFGLAGAVLAVPAAAFVSIIVDEFYLRPRHLDEAELEREASDLLQGKRDRTNGI